MAVPSRASFTFNDDDDGVMDRVEMDSAGDGNLPSYADLQQQAPPNSRFGRWREWIDKRASERFAEQTPEERTARQQRLGWGETIVTPNSGSLPTRQVDPEALLQAAHAASDRSMPPSYYPKPLQLGEPLLPTAAALYSFGSRFLTHSSSPIRCLLPLMRDRFLLIGTTEGVSVLDVLPSLHGGQLLGSDKGLEDARQHEIWNGVGMLQCALLEEGGDPARQEQGVVLALVTLNHTGDGDRTSKPEVNSHLRMYNLSSLISLVKWSVTQKETPPLDLQKSPTWQSQQSPSKKQKNRISKSLKNLLIEDHAAQSSSSPPRIASPDVRAPPRQPRSRTASESSDWEVIDDLPLRWATDFVPFVPQRLAGVPVLFFELWKGDEFGQRGRTHLAVATTKNILLYETPRGERAFTFVKEFYTPHPARSAKFIYQAPSDTVTQHVSHRTSLTPLYPSSIRSPSSENLSSPPTTPSSSPSSVRSRRLSFPTSTSSSPQLSLFVTFEKKAVTLRIADAHVGEVDLWEEASSPGEHSPPSHSGSRLFKAPPDEKSKGPWLPLAQLYLPVSSSAASSSSYSPSARSYYLVTRGKLTHLFLAPLPTPLVTAQPVYVHTWLVQPRQVVTRVIADVDGSSTLQLIGFGQFGAEIKDIPVQDVLGGNKGKGKSRGEEDRHAVAWDGLDVGFLCSGGEWDRQSGRGNTPIPRLARCDSSASTATQDGTSLVSDAGMYGWVRKDIGDHRVFWLGSSDAAT